MQPNKDFDLLYLAALRFLAHKPRTRSEVLLRLEKFVRGKKDKGYEISQSAQLITDVLDLLSEEKFINDEEYLRQYLSTQGNSGKKSLLLMKKFLLGKGLSREMVEDSLSEIKNNDSTTAKILAEKKLNSLSSKQLPARKIREKVLTYLLGKGLSFDDATDAVDSLMGVK